MTLLFQMFGKTKNLPLVTYTDGKKDEPARGDFVDTLWVERGEDWYGLMSYPRGQSVRVVTRESWLMGVEIDV